MGYRVHTFSPDDDTPTGQLADREVRASYDEEAAVRDFARGVDVLTFEFENIPVQTIDWAAEQCVVRPAGRVLHLCQHRSARRRSSSPSAASRCRLRPGRKRCEQLREPPNVSGFQAVLKTAAFGY
jgi:5-(carboxyamino)imidazole ribonucleotide synthase